MNWIKRALFGRRPDGDLREEIEQHRAEKTDQLVEDGMSKEEAMLAARREFGNVVLIQERSRDGWLWAKAEDLLTDVRYGFRQLRRAPAFAAASVLTLALGIH